MIRVYLVEDQPAVMRAQHDALAAFSDLTIAGASLSGEDALAKIGDVDVVVCDLGLPGVDGIEITRRLRARPKPPEVLVLTVFDEEERVLAAVRAGASGYLLKGAPAEKLAEAIREVHGGGSVIQPALARVLLKRFHDPEPPPTALSPREREILQLIGKGLSNAEAAQVLGLGRATVRTHLEHIYRKLDVSNRTEAVAEGLKKGLIEG